MATDFIEKIKVKTAKDSNEFYHSQTEYVGASVLKKFKESPAHWKYQDVREPSEALLFGSAYHCYILEPEEFDNEYYVFDDSEIIQDVLKEKPESKSPRATVLYKELIQPYLAKNQDKEQLTEIQMSKIKAMKRVLFAHPYARSLFGKGIAELSHYAEMTVQGGDKIKAKVRPDYLKADKKIIVDLKTCRDASIDGFQKDAAKFNYHIQAALYTDIINANYKDSFSFYFVAQEKVAPYAFNMFEASPNFIGQGRYEYEMLMLLWNQCHKDGKFPGYQVWCENKYGMNELNLPPWSVREINYYNHEL